MTNMNRLHLRKMAQVLQRMDWMGKANAEAQGLRGKAKVQQQTRSPL